MDRLEEQLSYKFRNPELLQQALTYTPFQTGSSSPLSPRKRTCDHLKILGDCVIKLMTSQYALCASPPNESVGKVVKIKDALSTRNRQMDIGKSLGLKEKGLIISNLPQDQIPASHDIFVKSIFGAVFLDAGGSAKKGFVSCWKLFLRFWQPVLGKYPQLKPLIACFPIPKRSSQEVLQERFSAFKKRDLALLEEKIGFKFQKHPHLLEQAMTHDSIELFKAEGSSQDPNCPDVAHFQNLEFLGDSVIELVIMEYLYLRSSSADPLGQMLFCTRDTGEKLYSSRFQIQVAKRLSLENFVIKPPTMGLACYDDFVESLIGGVYVCGKMIGLRACSKLVLEIWGLESSEEEDEVPESVPVVNGASKDAKPTSPVQSPKKAVKEDATVQAPTGKSSKFVALLPGRTRNAIEVHLETHLQYSFKDSSFLKYLPVKMDASSEEAKQQSMKLINTAKNIQTIGKCALDLVITEYVIGLCHSSETTDLSAKMKTSVKTLLSRLNADDVLADVTKRYQLSKHFVFKNEVNLPNPQETTSDVVHLLIGAVFLDTSAGIETVRKLFNRMWKSYMDNVVSKEIVNCFPDTSAQQTKFRTAMRATITPQMWKKLFTLLDYTVARKNLMEQALTDEKAQAYGKQVVNAYPLGNQFGLVLLGKALLALYVAQRTYLNCLEEPEKFSIVLERMDNCLYNSLKSRFVYLQSYYAKIFKDPYPPKRNLKAPFEAMFAAVYVDAGAGVKGYQQIQSCVVKCCPSVLTLKKAKAVPSVPTSTSALEDVATESHQDVVTSDVESISDLKPQSGRISALGMKEVPVSKSPVVLPSLRNIDPILDLQSMLSYDFKNPRILKVVLDGKSAGNEHFFALLEVVGNRVVNLLAAEFALETLPVLPNEDINEHGKTVVKERLAYIKGHEVVAIIYNALELTRSSNGAPPAASQEEVVTALLGAVFVDSCEDFPRLLTVFRKLWNTNVPGIRLSLLEAHFPLTVAGQGVLRSRIGKPVTSAQWKKLWNKLCYTFKNANLAEQALTDEGCQLEAAIKFQAYPTGNPFALKLLGKSVMQLAIASASLPATTNTPLANYVKAVDDFEVGLYNSFHNNFMGMSPYLATIPPNKKRYPNSVFDGLLGAVYVDSGFGKAGFDAVSGIIFCRRIGLKRPAANLFTHFDASDAPSKEADAFPPIENRPVTPVASAKPSSSSECSSLNNSFSLKCAANFGFSPVPRKGSPCVRSSTLVARSPEPGSSSSSLAASQNSSGPKLSYSNAVINGCAAETNKKLIDEITSAQTAIRTSRLKQEKTDHHRKLQLDLEAKVTAYVDPDETSNSSSSRSRSRYASTSTITSAGTGSKKQKDSKKKRRKNKKTKSTPTSANTPVVAVKENNSMSKSEAQESRISSWCQHQFDRIKTSTPDQPDASCIPEIHQERAISVEQTKFGNGNVQVVEPAASVQLESLFACRASSQSPSKMDREGLRKSDDDGYGTASSAGQPQGIVIAERVGSSFLQQDTTSTCVQIAKWASVIVVAALLVKRYAH